MRKGVCTRCKLISALYKNLLGPSGGPFETVKDDPRNEYITGILAPVDAGHLRDPDHDAEIPSMIPEDIPAPEDDVQDDFFLGHTTFLDPSTQPSSMGISFSVAPSDGYAEIKLCVTWARYMKIKNGWKRQPRYYIAKSIILKAGKLLRRSWYLNGRGQPCAREEAEVGIHIIVSPDPYTDEHINVSVFLVNELRLEDASDDRKAEQYVFQPQIRINVLRGKLKSVGKTTGKFSDEEEEELNLVYKDREVLARGHMCSAVWESVDPEKPYDDNFGEPPFVWVDGEMLDEHIKEEFTNPHLRTEFIPTYSIESPSYEWDRTFGPEPELEAAKLAELWDTEKLKEALLPLVNGYRRWIEELEMESGQMSFQERRTAERVIQKCRMTLERIHRGIEILLENKEARLAFCFANKVMDIQRTWINRQRGTGGGLRWRPFQIAFVLLSLPSVVHQETPERKVCDILFVPTGAGKTEAYLCLAAFTLAYRRRRAILLGKPLMGNGVGVMMRYTLRLLTIQQFRRALSMITACEYLRVHGLKEGKPVGWRPRDCDIDDDFIWGPSRFSIGLWVGGNVTPNKLGRKGSSAGALNILRGERGRYAEGEPAQIIRCPVCGAILSIPDEGMLADEGIRLHQIAKLEKNSIGDLEKNLSRCIHSVNNEFSEIPVQVELERITHHGEEYATISLKMRSGGKIKPDIVDSIWRKIEKALKTGGLRIKLLSARPSRPGYFLRYSIRRGIRVPYNFDIYCPNPDCPLNNDVLWCEGHPHPLDGVREIKVNGRCVALMENLFFRRVPEFTKCDSKGFLSNRIPVPALTVDEQVYSNPPSFLVGTVDKVARIAFEARSGTLFGNIDLYHPYLGYYREDLEPPTLTGMKSNVKAKKVKPPDPPDLIIQDELHLIEGPLGSMVGIYEAAVDLLSMRNGFIVKYVASSATIRGAGSQVRSVFAREVQIFPPYGLRAHDKFFIRQRISPHPLDERRPGRAYVGICSPGKGPLTPVRRIWGVLLKTVYDLARDSPENANYFWTLVGYFNAIRELAGVKSLYRQDIPEELLKLAGTDARRSLPEDNALELSSRTPSTELPVRLEELERHFTGDVENPRAIDALFTTSMFGTGIDIPRLSLMVVHGQPKTTSSYIQSTGRVGRKKAGLIVTFYRSTRPRDMSHYELFCGYHMNLERFVEPVTAAPFSEGSLDRCCGPVCVGMLRNMRGTQTRWHTENSAMAIITGIRNVEVDKIVDFLVERAKRQPPLRRPEPDGFEWFIRVLLDRWRTTAQAISRENGRLKYAEYRGAHNHVVLGDSIHQHKEGIIVVYENAPQSLRDIEETTSFET